MNKYSVVKAAALILLGMCLLSCKQHSSVKAAAEDVTEVSTPQEAIEKLMAGNLKALMKRSIIMHMYRLNASFPIRMSQRRFKRVNCW